MKDRGMDQIGYWSEIKLDIVREYASAYSTILNKQKSIRKYLYVDAFAGAGVHLSKQTGVMVPGSPLNALLVNPPFHEYHLIDLDGVRAEGLRKMAKEYGSQVVVHQGDGNQILLKDILPLCRYSDFHRALWLLDPYGLHVDWRVLEAAGKLKSVELFYNLSIMDANMNILKLDPAKASKQQLERMDFAMGGRWWYGAAYKTTPGLFDDIEEKNTNETFAEAFRQRLHKVAEFSYVPKPMPMRNSRGAIVYYLFFASPNKTGEKIVKDIFAKYQDKGVS